MSNNLLTLFFTQSGTVSYYGLNITVILMMMFESSFHMIFMGKTVILEGSFDEDE